MTWSVGCVMTYKPFWVFLHSIIQSFLGSVAQKKNLTLPEKDLTSILDMCITSALFSHCNHSNTCSTDTGQALQKRKALRFMDYMSVQVLLNLTISVESREAWEHVPTQLFCLVLCLVWCNHTISCIFVLVQLSDGTGCEAKRKSDM